MSWSKVWGATVAYIGALIGGGIVAGMLMNDEEKDEVRSVAVYLRPRVRFFLFPVFLPIIYSNIGVMIGNKIRSLWK